MRAVDRYSRSANWPTKNLKSVKVEAWNWSVNERNQCLYHGLTGFYTIRVSHREGNTVGEEKILPLTSRSCQCPRSSFVIEIDLKPNKYTNISSLRRAFVSVFSACTQSSVQFVWPKHSVLISLFYNYYLVLTGIDWCKTASFQPFQSPKRRPGSWGLINPIKIEMLSLKTKFRCW
mgnify:CR=1 FL=1